MKYMILLAVLLATPALAKERSVTVTQFDRVRIDGAFTADIVTNRGPSARITGTEQAIERTSIQMQGQTLVIKANRSAWGGWQGDDIGAATIHLTTAELKNLGSSGASTVKVDHMQGSAVGIAQDGSGSVTVAQVEADTLDLGMSGAGNLTVAGRAAQTRLAIRGAGTFDGTALTNADLRLNLDGSAVARVNANRSANVIANGSGTVVISGKPACTVVNRGSGSVSCGR